MRVGRVVAVLGTVLAVGSGVSALASAHSGHHEPSASKLVDRDPGARVGGNTVVVAGSGADVSGVPDRPNFIIALGSGDKIRGGDQNDELGAFGEGDTIVADRGHELIEAGPHGKIIVRGSGHDLVVDTHRGGTIDLESAHDEVIDTGHGDHIVCSGGAVHDVIYDNVSDTVSKSCRRHHDPVHPDASTVFAGRFAPPVAHAAAVTGAGTNDNPYTAPCDTFDPLFEECTVNSFPARSLTGLWANENVPAYRCPDNFRYLASSIYAPYGTKLPMGVEVSGLGPIGVSITGVSLDPGFHKATGTTTDSSATNWTTGSASYRVILHCTSNYRRGWPN